ncbi:unnamed protein product [Lymnaea stagnalis]|uniref:Uncharacterized protein n=1 Tax=Lymnaea stagnalis TaxID=6523 RepID=A0AAV2HIZ7_LYMST
MVEPPEEEFGTLSNQSVSNGLIGMLQRREVDLVMAPLAIDPLRDEVIDFTFPFFTEATLMVLRKPDPAEKKWLTLIRPFDWQVHIAIFISLIVATALITFLERINPYYRHKAITSELHGIADSLMYMFGALINQGGEQLPRSATGRTLLTFWWLYCIVVSSTYSGNLIAFLTVTKEPVPFYSLQGMLGQDKFKWGVMGKSIYEMLFQYSEDPVKQALWERIKTVNQSDPSVLSLNVNEHFGRVKREDYVFIVEKSITDYWHVDECDHILIKENLFTLHYAVGLVNGSPYTDLFSEQ